MFGIRQITYCPNTHRAHTDRNRSGQFAGVPGFPGHIPELPAISMYFRPFSWIPKLPRPSGLFSYIPNQIARFPGEFPASQEIL